MEALVERKQPSAILDGRGQGECVRQSKRGMLRPQRSGPTRDRSIDRDDPHSGGVDEVLDDLWTTRPQRADENLRVDARADQNGVSDEMGAERVDGLTVLGVGGLDEADEDIGVERYRSHSSRSASR